MMAAAFRFAGRTGWYLFLNGKVLNGGVELACWGEAGHCDLLYFWRRWRDFCIRRAVLRRGDCIFYGSLDWHLYSAGVASRLHFSGLRSGEGIAAAS